MRKVFIFPLIICALITLAFIDRKSHKWNAGEKYKGFVVTKSLDLPDIQSKLIELSHEETGAEVLYIKNDDPENFFSIAFRTPPTSSNGAPHVLEHTVFQGTKKFPAKGLFHELKQRSIPTYMNAGTGPDFTSFHAASQVEADFYNLLEVYLDAAFHPLLRPISFAQEGHRVEFADGAGELEYKGVVFNEMKGKLASNRALFMQAINQALFADSHYRFNAGGEPSEIPKLTHEELVSFHKEHYFAGNALFFFHGNLPLEKHLDFLAAHALNDASYRPPLPEAKKQPRFTQKVSQELFYPARSNAEESLIGYSFLACTAADTKGVLALKILDTILMGSDAGLLKRALLKSEIVKQARASLDTVRAEVSYTLCFEGVKAEDAEKLDQLIFKTLAKIDRKGISNDLIESSIDKIELERSEIGQGHVPFELSPFIKSALLKLHGGNAEDGLRIHSLFEELRNTLLKNPKFLQEILRKHLLQNTHCVRVVLKPSLELAEEKVLAEKLELQRLQNSLSDDEIAKIIAVSKEIREPNKVAAHLPKISLDSIPKKGKGYDVARLSEGSLDIFYNSTFTNHVTYADLVLSLPEIEDVDLWLVQLFANLLPALGSGGRSADDTLKRIHSITGGVKASLAIYQNDQEVTPSLHIATYSLDRHAQDAFRLLYDIATSANFQDKTRIKQHIIKECYEIENAIQQNPLNFAIDASLASSGSANYLLSKWRGLEYYEKIKHLKDHFDELYDNTVAKLQALQAAILTNHPAHLIVTTAKETFNQCQKSGFGGLSKLPTKNQNSWKCNFTKKQGRSFAYLTTSPIAFTAKSFKTVGYSHPDSAATLLASYLFEHKVLRKRIREEGGAYDGGTIYNPTSANFSFYSYRDPALSSTLKAFDEAIEVIGAGNFTAEDLEMAKLEAIQSLDTPISPGDKAKYAYVRILEGKTDAVYQDFRTRLLKLEPHDIKLAVQAHIAPGFQEAVIVTFAGFELMERENPKLSTPLESR